MNSLQNYQRELNKLRNLITENEKLYLEIMDLKEKIQKIITDYEATRN